MATEKDTKVALVALTGISHNRKAIAAGEAFEVDAKQAQALLDAGAARLDTVAKPKPTENTEAAEAAATAKAAEAAKAAAPTKKR